MKKYLVLLLVLLLTLGLASAELEYDFVEGGIEITGITEFRTGSLNIPSTIDGHTVVGIADEAFRHPLGGVPYFDGTLTLPSTLQYIGSQAFRLQDFTGSLVIPNSVHTIGSMAFASNEFSGTLTLSNNLVYIADDAFVNNYFTGDLVIPEGVEIIGESIVAGSNFNNLILPDSLKEIHHSGLSWGGFSGTLNLPPNLERVDRFAFTGNSFSGNLVIPDSVQKIGRQAFGENNFNGELTLPNNSNFTVIEDFVFYQNSFSGNLTIPPSITLIKEHALADANFDYVFFTNRDINLVYSSNYMSSFAYSYGLTFVGHRYKSDGVTDSDIYLYVQSSPGQNFNTQFQEILVGCTDPEAINYDPSVEEDDGSCYYNPGCTDEEAYNYDSEADFDDGSCIPVVLGCTDEEALNHDPDANTDDGSCEYPAPTSGGTPGAGSSGVVVSEGRAEAVEDSTPKTFKSENLGKLLILLAIVSLIYYVFIMQPAPGSKNSIRRRRRKR